MTPTNVQQALTGLALGEKTILDIKEGSVDFRIVKEPKPLQISPPKQHAFKAVDGFVAYLKKYGGTDTVVLCDPLTGLCQATLNEKAATGFEVVTFTPQMHPTFAEWAAILGEKLDVRGLATFVQKQRRTITNGPELAKTLRQIKASTKIELSKGQGNGSVNGVMVTTKIQGKDADNDIDLPETITAEMPLFIDSTGPAQIEFDLTLEGNGQGTDVFATLTAPTLDVIRFEELQEYAAKFDGFTFGFGSIQHGQWKFID